MSGIQVSESLFYVTSHYHGLSETFVTTLVTGLADLGWNVTVACEDLHNGPSHPRVHPVHTQHRNLRSRLDRWRHTLSRNRRADPKSYSIRREAAARLFKPLVLETRPQVAMIDFGYNAVLALPTCKSNKIPMAVHFHGSDITSYLADQGYRSYLPELFEYASAFIVASHHIARLLILEGCPADKIRLVRLEGSTDGVVGVDWSVRRLAPPSVAFLGRLTPKKNPVALVEAFGLAKQSVPNATLTIIGSGEELTRVKDRVTKLRLSESVELIPGCPRPEALRRLANHWVYAQHSVTAVRGDQEGFALSLAEAALLEMPVVSTWHNGIPEQVVDGETGYLVPEFDFPAMGQRLIQLLSDSDLCERLGANGRKRISELCPQGQRAIEVDRILKTLS